ncbi:hypothetical protein NVP1215B_018 [Vibrio phage 1.215.B._10N.222.54.F7]|nr:hypothetical protein NVP1215A_018 [Vibrio phage 1.215.A._10N.222.54.F7]AUR96041.1 hypothetical protein NVP1215B_018 [Vibrio phage 1.215.B._10N.222.54.F7]
MRARKKYQLSEAVITAKVKYSVSVLAEYAEDLKPGDKFTLPSYYGGTINYTILGLFVNGHSNEHRQNYKYGRFRVMVAYSMELNGNVEYRSYPAGHFLTKAVNGNYRTRVN